MVGACLKISTLKNHYIICGAGETGYTAIKSFLNSKLDFVVIEKNAARAEELKREDILTVLGDATNEDALNIAKIKNAKGLISTLSNDGNSFEKVGFC